MSPEEAARHSELRALIFSTDTAGADADAEQIREFLRLDKTAKDMEKAQEEARAKAASKAELKGISRIAAALAASR